MFEWFPRRAAEAEVAVARAILDGANDPAAELLLEQFRTSRRVQRHIEGATLRVVVPWTTEDLMVNLDQDVSSDAVRARDVLSGQPLWFRVHLARGGFFRCLEGQGDARWPRRWDVDRDELAAAASGALRLPHEPAPDVFAQWLGVAATDVAGLVVRRPATKGPIDGLQQREALALPAQVREFLEITDGLVVGDWAVLGTRDLHVVEVDGDSYWQIAVGVGPEHDRRCLLGVDGRLVEVPAHDAAAEEFEPAGADLRDWIAGLLDVSDRPD